MKHLEIKSFNYGNVTVTVKFDYDKQEVSLVNRSGNGENWMPMTYVFAKRNPKDMETWAAVLEALLTTVKGAKEEMQAFINSLPEKKQG